MAKRKVDAENKVFKTSVGLGICMCLLVSYIWRNLNSFMKIISWRTPDCTFDCIALCLMKLLFSHFQLANCVLMYPLFAISGDIGGQLGLFLGSSLLTYVEFFDCILMVIYTKYFEVLLPR